jgi:hypothetical protein
LRPRAPCAKEEDVSEGRRVFLGGCLAGALAACRTSAGSAPSSGTPSASPGRGDAGAGAERTAPQVVDLAWHNLSLFHGDGERLAFVNDGRVFYERLERGALLRWEQPLLAAAAAELAGAAARLAATAPVVPQRLGVPDEVSVLLHFRDGAGQLRRVDVWEDDLGKLPPGHVLHEVRFAVTRAAEALTQAGPGRAAEPDDAERRWPFVFT